MKQQLKKLTTLLALLMATNYLNSQTIILTEGSMPYTNQTWFYSSHFNGDEVKKYWDEGKRITSVSYTKNGWFVSMSANSGITKQSYKISEEWPKDWVNEKYDEGYLITSVSYSGKEWLVVFSVNSGLSGQTTWTAEWSKLQDYIKEYIGKGYYITNATYGEGKWRVVLSGSSPYSYQNYFFANNISELKSTIRKEVYDKSYRVHLIECGNGQYFCVYGKYKKDELRSQNWVVNPDNVKDFINERWNNNQSIVYIGGSYSTTEQNNRTPVAKNDNLKTWREELGYGMFAINTEYSSGIRSRTIWRLCGVCRGTKLCSNCHGLKMCTICGGKGHIISAGYGTYIPCYACGFSGSCGVCHGSGLCICTKYDYPGYQPGSTLTLDKSGNELYNSRNSNLDFSLPSSNSSNAPSNDNRYGMIDCHLCYGTGTCQTCGGDGLSDAIYTTGYNGMECPNCCSSRRGRCGKCCGTGKVYGLK